MNGIVVINKEPGYTSHDVVAKARGILKIKKIGHAGTLDPLATGVLILLVGKATKLSNQFMGFDKAYRSTMKLGMKTTSADIQGETIDEKEFSFVTQSALETVFKKFTGDIEQLPPMVSAVRHKGKKLYELARKGITVERKSRPVTIRELSVLEFNLPYVQFFMDCSKGTYVRQLVDDVGDELGCGACISQIERTKVGSFTLDQAVLIGDLNESHIRDWQSQE